MAAVPERGRASGAAHASSPETAAAEQLYQRHRGRVFSFCLYQLGDRERAEDAVQTTFLHAFRSIRRGVRPTAERAWLLKIARNVCVAGWRSERRRSSVEVVRDPQTLDAALATPEREPIELECLRQALRRLPEQQRRAILLREWQGLSYSEIADRLDTTVPAVEALVFRARRSLSESLRRERTPKRGLNLGSLLAALKSLLGGSVIKVAVTAAALTSATALSVTGDAADQRGRTGVSTTSRSGVAAVAPAARAEDWQRSGGRAAALAPGFVGIRRPAHGRRSDERGGPTAASAQSRDTAPAPSEGAQAQSAGAAAAPGSRPEPQASPPSAPTATDAVSDATHGSPVPLPDTPTVTTPAVTTPAVTTPAITTPSVSTPDLPTPSLPATPPIPVPKP